MASEKLKLKRYSDGYWRTNWYDDSGKRHFRSFGLDEEAARTDFNRFHHRWKREPSIRRGEDDGTLTVKRLAAMFDVHAQTYYRHKDGTPTGEATNMADAMRIAVELFPSKPAVDFSAPDLKACQDALAVSMGRGQHKNKRLSRPVINTRIRKIRQVFGWAVAEGLVPELTWYGLRVVKALSYGRTDAPEPEAVTAVADSIVALTMASATSTLKAMAEVQRYSGMRPGEVCAMRLCDIDVSGKVWLYTPGSEHRFGKHKTAHHGKRRVVLLGPRCQAAIKPLITAETTAYLFSPRRSMREVYNQCKVHRRKNQEPNEPKTERKIGDHYTTNTYAQAIARLCQKAGVPKWSPNQLRHTAATAARKAGGLDFTQLMLGHEERRTTEGYAKIEVDTDVIEAAAKFG